MSDLNYKEDYINFLYKSGLLFEINRVVLHPLGYALVVELDEDTKEAKSFFGLWDSTDDPTGIWFNDEDFKVGKEKFDKFMEAVPNENLSLRIAELGYIVQDSLL